MRELSPERIKEALLLLAADWIDRCHGEIRDVADYQRIVKSVLDLTRKDDDPAQTIRVILDPPTDQYAV
jgi:hypothetical protein